MGLTKRLLEVSWYERYRIETHAEKKVCALCMTSKATENDKVVFQRIVEESKSASSCDFCHRQGDDLIACEIGNIVAFIGQQLEEVGYIPDDWSEGMWADGDWVWRPSVHEGSVLLSSHPLGCSDEVYECLEKAIDKAVPDGFIRQDDRMEEPSGDQFAGLSRWGVWGTIVHERRTFFGYDGVGKGLLDNLKTLSDYLNKHSLYRKLKSKEMIYRGRILKPDIKPTPQNLGPPQPKEQVTANRMNPPGISMFYGALDEETAVLECYQLAVEEVRTYLGSWVLQRDLLLVDLTQLPSDLMQSVDKIWWRGTDTDLGIISMFSSEIRRPIIKDGKQVIPYIITQVITEYLRYIHRNEAGESIQGIIYPSMIKEEGENIALFILPSMCAGSNKAGERPTLVLKEYDAYQIDLIPKKLAPREIAIRKDGAIEALKIIKQRFEREDRQRLTEYNKELVGLLQAENYAETEKEKESVAYRIRTLRAWISMRDEDEKFITVLQRYIDKE